MCDTKINDISSFGIRRCEQRLNVKAQQNIRSLTEIYKQQGTSSMSLKSFQKGQRKGWSYKLCGFEL